MRLESGTRVSRASSLPRSLVPLLAGLLLPGLLLAQGRVLNDADYARAERFVGYTTLPLVDHAVTSVTWLDDGHFWYRDHDANGDRFLVMDARTGTATPAFDRERLAAGVRGGGHEQILR